MNTPSTEQIAKFIGESILKYRNVKFEFHPTPKLKIGGIECTGEAVKDRLSIATGGPLDNWLEVFIHETSHLDQQAERPKWFEECDMKVELLTKWLDDPSIQFNTSDLFKIIELEHDCESRTISKINKYGLPIDTKLYSKKANAYILSYGNTYKNKKWDVTPYQDTKRLEIMPDELISLSRAIGLIEELI